MFEHRSPLLFRRRSRPVAAPAAAVALSLLVGACGDPATRPAPEPVAVPVEITPVVRDNRPIPIHAAGRLASKSELRLSFKIGGIVRTISVQEGERVRRGQRLARLEPAEIEAEVKRATVGFDKAQRDLDRAESLFRDSVATLEQAENARSALEAASAALDIARFNRRFAEIVAPVGGRVLRRLAEPGELVGAGAPILFLGAEERGWVVRVGVSDRDVVRIAPGDSARLRFDAFPDRPFTATVSEIAGAADPMSGTFEVELTVDSEDERLKTGFFARAEILPAVRDSLDFIPISALTEGDDRVGFVFLLDPDEMRVRRREIGIAHILDDSIAVRAGLDPLDQVVTAGASYLSDSTAVRVVH